MHRRNVSLDTELLKIDTKSSVKVQRRGSTGSSRPRLTLNKMLSESSLNTSKSTLLAANNALWGSSDADAKPITKVEQSGLLILDDTEQEEGKDTVAPLMASSKPYGNRKSLFRRAASLKRFGLSKGNNNNTKDHFDNGNDTTGGGGSNNNNKATSLSAHLDSSSSNNKTRRSFFQKAATMRLGKSKLDGFDEMSLNDQSDEFSLHSTNQQQQQQQQKGPTSSNPNDNKARPGLSSLGQSLRRLNDLSLDRNKNNTNDDGSGSLGHHNGSSSRFGESSTDFSVASPTLWRENSEEMRPGLQFAPSTLATMLTEKQQKPPPQNPTAAETPTDEATADHQHEQFAPPPPPPIGQSSTCEQQEPNAKAPIVSTNEENEIKPDTNSEESSDLPQDDSAPLASKEERPRKLKGGKNKSREVKTKKKRPKKRISVEDDDEKTDELGSDSGHSKNSKKTKKVRKKRKGGKKRRGSISEKEVDEAELNEDNAFEAAEEGNKRQEKDQSEHNIDDTEHTEVEEETLPDENKNENETAAKGSKKDTEEADEIQSTDGDSDIFSMASAKNNDGDIAKGESKESLVDESSSTPNGLLTKKITKSEDFIEPTPEQSSTIPPAPIVSLHRSKSLKNPLMKNHLGSNSPKRRRELGSRSPKSSRPKSKRLSADTDGSRSPKSSRAKSKRLSTDTDDSSNAVDHANEGGSDEESSKASRRRNRLTELQQRSSLFKGTGHQKTRRRRSLGSSVMKLTGEKGKGYISSFLGGSAKTTG